MGIVNEIWIKNLHDAFNIFFVESLNLKEVLKIIKEDVTFDNE